MAGTVELQADMRANAGLQRYRNCDREKNEGDKGMNSTHPGTLDKPGRSANVSLELKQRVVIINIPSGVGLAWLRFVIGSGVAALI